MSDITELERQLDSQAEKAKPQAHQSTQSQSTQRRDTGKSREEVMAEREAKKKAKIAAKEARKAAAAEKSASNAKGAKGDGGKESKGSKGGHEDKGAVSGKEDNVKDDKKQRKHSTIDPHIGHTVPLQFDDPKKYAKYAKKGVVQRTRIQKMVPLFSHLPQYERESSLSLQVGFSSEELHPAIVRLGLKYAEGTLSGSNARCVALLNAFKEVIVDYVTPPQKVLSLHLSSVIKPLVRFLIDCRPQSISMGNALRFLKMKIANIKDDVPEEQAKAFLIESIDSFIKERIEFADQVIADRGVGRVQNGDVILTYAKSHVVELTFKKAFDEGRQFRVIVVDSRPKLEGKEMARRLTQHGIKCTYILINAVSYVMEEVSKVFMGASALLANGTVISRVGSAVVGMMAHTYNTPLLVFCETYKMHERVQLDSICFNELGDPDELISNDRDDCKYGDVLTDWRDQQKLKLLNLTYDSTPPEFVSMVITEVGMIPATSVPVILREYHKDQYMAN